MTPAQRNRLYITAQHVLHSVSPRELQMDDWAGQILDEEGYPCGFAGCVVGHACQVPALQKEGLHMAIGTPLYAGWSGWQAVIAFYGLTGDDAHFLFAPSSYQQYPAGKPSPEVVATRIMDFLNTTGEPQ